MNTSCPLFGFSVGSWLVADLLYPFCCGKPENGEDTSNGRKVRETAW